MDNHQKLTENKHSVVVIVVFSLNFAYYQDNAALGMLFGSYLSKLTEWIWKVYGGDKLKSRKHNRNGKEVTAQ